MKKLDKINKQLEDFLNAPGKELGRWARLIRFQIQLWRFCAKQLKLNNAMALSSALSFRTIFAMIPTIALGILVLKQVGGLESSKKSLHEFLDKAGFTQIVIMEGEEVETQSQEGVAEESTVEKPYTAADKIEELVAGVEGKLSFKKLGPVGVALLIWSAITLLTTMERALNRIYGAMESRGLWRRILLYWSVVTLGPVLLTITIYLGEKMIGVLGSMPVLSFLISSVGWVGPILVQILLLGILYMLMPNTRVSFRAAVGGAMVAVPLWLIVKWAFGQYIGMVVQKGSLYGALGSLPLFLMWLNFSWLIFLFGAELSHTAANLTNLQMAEQASRLVLGPGELLATAIAVSQPYCQGAGPVRYEQMREQLNLPDVTLQRLLDRLVTLGIVCPVEADEAGGFVLARPAERIKMLEILELIEEETAASKSRYAEEVQNTVTRFKLQAKGALGDVTLADILESQKDV